METPRTTRHDQDTADLTATIIDTMAAYLEDSDTHVYEGSETGACMISLRNGRTFRIQLVEID